MSIFCVNVTLSRLPGSASFFINCGPRSLPAGCCSYYMRALRCREKGIWTLLNPDLIIGAIELLLIEVYICNSPGFSSGKRNFPLLSGL